MTTASAMLPKPVFAPKPVALVHRIGPNATVTFQLNRDLILPAEDQATAQGLSLADWLQVALNDALRSYLGG